MLKHKYRGWIIFKSRYGGYFAERQQDSHFAPENYKTLYLAKMSIDDGSAALTAKEFDEKIAHCVVV